MHVTTKDSWRNQRCADALVDVVCNRDRNLIIRLMTIESILKLARNEKIDARALIGISSEKGEPLCLRWVAMDALSVISPDSAELLTRCGYPELLDRSIDPDNPPPELDVDEELNRIAKKQQKEMYLYPLIALLILGVIFGAFFSYGEPHFRYLITGVAALSLIIIILVLIMAGRCPGCGRFFAREKKKYVKGYDGPNMPIGSLGPGGSLVHSKIRVSVYEVRCRYCSHPWVILR